MTQQEKNVIKHHIDSERNHGRAIWEIADDYQVAFKRGMISRETFFTAREYYCSLIGIKVSGNADDYVV